MLVLVPFPFSGLSKSKLRPAVVSAGTGYDDWILCQITSNPYSDPKAVTITDDSFTQGSLQKISYARPGKLFTANRQLIKSEVGFLKKEALEKVIDTVVGVIKGGLGMYKNVP
jgi:mRNA interferase MazF